MWGDEPKIGVDSRIMTADKSHQTREPEHALHL